MAGNLKISQLTDGSPAQSGDIIPLDRAGTNYSTTAGSIAALAGVTIGGTVSGGTAGSILYVSAGPVLAQDNTNLKWGTTAGQGLTLGAGTATTGVSPLLITQTWNANAAFPGIKAIFSTGASGGTNTGNLLDLQYGATASEVSVFTVKANGIISGATTGTTLTIGTGSGTASGAILSTSNSISGGGFALYPTSVTPTANNYALVGATGVTELNVASGGTIYIGVNGGASQTITSALNTMSLPVSIAASQSYQVAGKVLTVATAPSIASGFGSSPSIVASNGTAAFTVNVGTGGAASSGVITMPTATTGWLCVATPSGAPQAAAVTYSAPTSTTSITLTNYTLTTGIGLAWTASLVLEVHCAGY